MDWIITDIGPRAKKATRTFGPYNVIVGHGPYGGSYRITTATTILVQIDQLPVKSIAEAIGTATAQIKALVDALAPFSALAAEVTRLHAKTIALQADAGNWRRQFDAARDALDARHAEATEAEAVIASTRALLTEAEAALARQEARIAELEANAEADADAATIAHLETYLSRAGKRLARYVRAKEQSVMGAEDAGEEGGQ